MRHRESGNHANGCLPIFLSMRGLRNDAAAGAGRLLRVLLLRVSAVSADSGKPFGQRRGGLFLREKES
jgi:hypothetical protein